MPEVRPANEYELAILRKLLTVEFAGRDELLSQLDGLEIEPVLRSEIFDIKTSAGGSASVIQRVPVEAEGTDVDGARIMVLLHVIGGFMRELEFYRADGQPMQSLPAVDSLRVFSRDPAELRRPRNS